MFLHAHPGIFDNFKYFSVSLILFKVLLFIFFDFCAVAKAVLRIWIFTAVAPIEAFAKAGTPLVY